MEANGNEKRVLVVDDERDMLVLLKKVIAKKCGCTVRVAESGQTALALVETWQPDVVLTDIKMPGMDGLDFLSKLRLHDRTISSIIMTGYGTIEMAVRALKDGAYDFFEKPFENERIVRAVDRALERTELLRENRKLSSRLEERGQGRRTGIIGKSKKLVAVCDLLEKIAPSQVTVLIRGESGTGKELAARALHAMSSRARRKMVTVNCPALPEQILESELFGYRKGAFTGADRDKEGLFLKASGSTILLDEIADIPVSIQTKLLRVLQEKEIQPLGQTNTIPIDVRVVASTNQNLEEKIEQGEFREDLYYRLNVVSIVMPSLREIKNDIPLLAQHFLKKYCKEHGRDGLTFKPETLRSLLRRSWRGNIRELQNAINRAVLMCDGPGISPCDIIEEQEFCPKKNGGNGGQPCFHDLPYKEAKEEVLSAFTRSYVANIMTKNQGNVSAAARQCGMERQALQRIMRRFEIRPGAFRS